MKTSTIALLALAGAAVGAEPSLLWTLDCTNGDYEKAYAANDSPIEDRFSTDNVKEGVGVVTSGGGEDKSGVSLNPEQLKPLKYEFSLSVNLAEVMTTFSTEAENQELTLIGIKKILSDESIDGRKGYFYVQANSQTGIITINLLDFYTITTEIACYDVALKGGTTESQTLTLTFGNIENSDNALISVYLGNQLAATATFDQGHRNGERVDTNLMFGYGDPGIASVISNISYYEGVITMPTTSINPTVPEPTTATLSLLALAGLAARRRRK